MGTQNKRNLSRRKSLSAVKDFFNPKKEEEKGDDENDDGNQRLSKSDSLDDLTRPKTNTSACSIVVTNDSGDSDSSSSDSDDTDTEDTEELEKLCKLNEQLMADIEILTLSTATLLDPVYSVATSHVTERLTEIFTEDISQIVDLVINAE